jgi:hypothetical protein
MHLKGNWSLKRLQAVRRVTRKAESILSTEINFTTSSDEGEEYLFTSSKPFRYSKTKLVKSSHPTTELVVSLIVNNEEHLLKVLADTGASSIIILEAYTSVPFIKTDNSNTTTWSTMGGKFSTTKTEIFLWHFHSQSSTSRNKCVILGNFMYIHVDYRSESSSTYDMIMGRDLLGELGIIMNFHDHTVTWDTDTIPMKDRGTLSSVEALIEILFIW